MHNLQSEWPSKHDTKPPAAQSSEDSTVITTEHNAASGKSRKRKAAEALLNTIHLAADSKAQKKQRQEALVVSFCCFIVPWAINLKFWPHPAVSFSCRTVSRCQPAHLATAGMHGCRCPA